MIYNIIIAGSRTFDNYDVAKNVLRNFLLSKNTKKYPTIICGMAKGADMIGYEIAKKNNLRLKEFPANWNKFGRSAGYIRNKEMAKYAQELGNGVLIAFWDGISRGTKI